LEQKLDKLSNKRNHSLRTFYDFFAVAAIPITATFPSALLVYWSANGFFSLIQLLLYKTHFIRKLFNIPKITPPNKVQIPTVTYSTSPKTRKKE